MAFTYERQIKDASLVKSKALPAAGANNNSGTFDLATLTGGALPETFGVEVSIPALSAHTDTTKNVTIKVQHSDDDSSYVDTDDGVGILPTISFATPGVASTGSAARIVRFRLPAAGLKRYIQFNQAITSAGPAVTGSSVTYSLIF